MKNPKAVLESFQTQINTHLSAADECHRQGRSEEALTHLQEACEFSGEHPEIVRALGNHLYRLGRYDQARKRFEQLVRIQPNDASAHAGVALACQRCGPPEQFERALSSALTLDPRNKEALKVQADYCLSKGELKAALESYLKVLPQYPNDLGVLHGLGATLFRGGEKRHAADVYRKILGISPSDSLAKANLSLITAEAKGEVAIRATEKPPAVDQSSTDAARSDSGNAVRSDLAQDHRQAWTPQPIQPQSSNQAPPDTNRGGIIYDDIADDIQKIFQRHGNPRRDCNFTQKEVVAAEIASLVNRHFEFKPNALQQQHKCELKREGISRLGRVFDRRQVEEIVEYFRMLPVYNKHVWAQSDGIPRFLHDDAKKHRFGSYKQLEILNAPFLLETALHPAILNIAEDYLGCTPLLFSINVWWNFGGFHVTRGITQDFHRDPDDFKFLSFFTFLTDVGAHGGQHVFIRKTHDKKTLLEHIGDSEFVDKLFRDGDDGYGRFSIYEQRLSELMEDVRGEAGQGFIADTYGLHRGVPSERDRFICWCRYGLHKNRSYEYDKTYRVPVSQILRKVTLSDKTRFITSLILDDQN